MGEMRRSFGTLGTTPLLLNLMLSEYQRHESLSGAIYFDGALARAPTRYVPPKRIVTILKKTLLSPPQH